MIDAHDFYSWIVLVGIQEDAYKYCFISILEIEKYLLERTSFKLYI